MAKYRGSKGSLKLAANTMANVTAWEGNLERPFIEGTAMGDNAQTGKIDVPKMSGRVTAQLDYADAAQAAVLDILVANTDPAAITAKLEVDSTGPKDITVDILPVSAPISARKGALIEVTFNFESVGVPAINWT